MPNAITIATDGSCIQQGTFRAGDDTPRPGACGFVAELTDGSTAKHAVPFANGTIGAMEVKALLMGLEAARALAPQSNDPIVIKCDSQYAVNGYNEWLAGWAAKGYHKKGGLANAEDWRSIDQIKSELGRRVSVQWVRGHNGDRLNEMCDSLVNGSARSQTPHRDTDALPGYVSTVDTRPQGAGVTLSGLSSTPSVTVAKASQVATPEATPSTGVKAQAEALLAAAAKDPNLSSFLATSLELTLQDKKITGVYGPAVVEDAQTLLAALERRGNER